ncbi:MAG: hypothetical protein ACAH27_05705 [Xanthobacteraceae bacterium]
MADPFFPGDLPSCPTLGGWSGEEVENYVEFKPDTGGGKRRRRTTAETETREVNLARYTTEQRDKLRTFRRVDLKSGSLPFMYPEPGGRYFRCLMSPIKWRLVSPGKYEIGLTLTILPY